MLTGVLFGLTLFVALTNVNRSSSFLYQSHGASSSYRSIWNGAAGTISGIVPAVSSKFRRVHLFSPRSAVRHTVVFVVVVDNFLSATGKPAGVKNSRLLLGKLS